MTKYSKTTYTESGILREAYIKETFMTRYEVLIDLSEDATYTNDGKPNELPYAGTISIKYNELYFEKTEGLHTTSIYENLHTLTLQATQEHLICSKELPIYNWSALTFKEVSFDLLNFFPECHSDIDIEVQHEHVKHISFSTHKTLRASLLEGISIQKVNTHFHIKFKEPRSLEITLSLFKDLVFFLALRRSLIFSPYNVTLHSDRGPLSYFGLNNSHKLLIPLIQETPEIFAKNFNAEYLNWERYTNILLFPEAHKNVVDDIYLQYSIARSYVASPIDMQNFSIIALSSGDPRIRFLHVFDFFELTLRSFLLLQNDRRGRIENQIAVILKYYLRDDAPKNTRNLYQKSYKDFGCMLDAAVKIRNKMHHTYLSKKPLATNLQELFDSRIQMNALATFLWEVTWSITVLDIIKIPVARMPIIKRICFSESIFKDKDRR